MKYTTLIHPDSFDRPIGRFDRKGNVVYNKFDHYDIDVLDVKMQSQINNESEIQQLAEQLYPEVVQVLGDNPYMGIRVLLERTIKFIIQNGTSLAEFEKSMLRQYGAMRMDLDIFGLERENG